MQSREVSSVQLEVPGNCKECSSHFRRRPRKGFWQRQVMARLGYFPWECSLCRGRKYFRQRSRQHA